jgi:hypothetical protein
MPCCRRDLLHRSDGFFHARLSRRDEGAFRLRIGETALARRNASIYPAAKISAPILRIPQSYSRESARCDRADVRRFHRQTPPELSARVAIRVLPGTNVPIFPYHLRGIFAGLPASGTVLRRQKTYGDDRPGVII